MSVEKKEIVVSGEVTSNPARNRFFLNEALSIDELVVGSTPIAFTRTKNRVDVSSPLTTFRIRYHGTLQRSQSAHDHKSDAWIEPAEVRLTEVTAFYPIFYDGIGTFPWPPVPGVGRLTVAPVAGLRWIASSQHGERNTFIFTRPSDFVLVGLPYSPTRIPLDAPHADFSLTVYSPRSTALRSTLVAALGEHLNRFGPLEETTMNVVEFPATGTTNGLAFLSSNLIVLSSKTCDYVAQGTPRALRVVGHEFAHRWFGGVLRATGPATRWLVESFAEYYAWRVVRDRLGQVALDEVLSEVRKSAGVVPVPIPELGWEDERVYTAGALGVLALADALGPRTLDSAVRSIASTHGEWSAANLFRAMTELGGNEQALQGFRSSWGL